MEKCVTAVWAWMRENMLKMNDEKTEFMVISSKHAAAHIGKPCLQIGDAAINHASKVRNIGAFFDHHMNMEVQVNHVSLCLLANKETQFH